MYTYIDINIEVVHWLIARRNLQLLNIQSLYACCQSRNIISCEIEMNFKSTQILIVLRFNIVSSHQLIHRDKKKLASFPFEL